MQEDDDMRAILIDPEKKTVTEIQMQGGDYKETLKILRCHSFTTGAFLNGSMEEGYDCIAVSDNDPADKNERHWFQVDADCDPPSSFPIAGLGLVQGVDKEGETTDASIGIEELAKRITFTERKFRGFEMHSEPGIIAVSPVAPIIDGASE